MNKILMMVVAGLAFAALADAGRPEPADAPYRNPDLPVERRIDDLLPRLTPAEKGQLIHTISSVTFGGIPRIGLASFKMLGSGTGPRATDRPGVTAFPAPIAHAATFDRSLVRDIGRAMGAETRAVYPRKDADAPCVSRALAGPGVNIARTPLGGRSFEYLGEDPVLAGEIAAAWILGLQSVNVAPCMKHYCFNDQEYARLNINVECGDRAAREIYIRPFEIAARKADPWTFMNSYNRYRGVWTSHSAYLNDILGKEYGATGAFIPDWGGTHGMPAAINGGTSVESGAGRNPKRDAEEQKMVAEGKIDASRYDEAVRRALRFYFRVGAFDADTSRERALQAECEKAMRSPEHQAIARRAAEESFVLAKNDGLLPFEKAGAKVAVVGPYADVRHFMHANDTRLGLFGGAGAVKAAREITPLEGFRTAFGAENVLTGTNHAELAARADLVVYCGGIDHLYESEAGGAGHVEPNDRRDIYLRAFDGRIQEDEICAISAVNPNVVVALTGGSPVSVEEWHERVRAVFMTWYAGEFGGEVLARMVRGEVNPSGRLPYTYGKTLHDWPSVRFGRRSYPGEYDLAAEAVATGQNGGWDRKEPQQVYLDGIWVGYRGFDRFKTNVRYPFGHGLSYTTFETTVREVSDADAKGVRRVRVSVRNAGSRAGRHAVLLWASKPAQADEPEMPAKELVDFASVELGSGEEKTVEFAVGFEQVKYWSEKANAWKMPVGTVAFRAE